MNTLATQLRPRSMSELLDQAFRLYRRHFFTFVTIIAVVQIPTSLLQLLISSLPMMSQMDPAMMAYDPGTAMGSFALTMMGSLLSSAIALVLVQGIGNAAVTQAIADDYMGSPISFMGAYRRIGKKWGTLVKTLLFSWLVSIVIALWLLVPCVGWLSGIGMILFFSMGVLPLVSPAVIMENQGGARAYLRRAWDLVRRRFWWVIGFSLLLALFNIILTAPATLITVVLQFAGLSDWFNDPSTALVVQTIVQSVVNTIVSILYSPLRLAAMTLLYFDLRIRFESLDLDYMAAQVYDETSSPETLLAEAPAPQNDKLVTREELGKFILFTIGYFVIVFVIGGIFGLGSAFLGGM